jgi:hypothetical protein
MVSDMTLILPAHATPPESEGDDQVSLSSTPPAAQCSMPFVQADQARMLLHAAPPPHATPHLKPTRAHPIYPQT